MNVPPYGEELKKIFSNIATLYVKAQDSPNMTVKISAGGFWIHNYTGSSYIEYAGGNSPTLTAPISNVKISVIAFNTYGQIVVIDGSPAADPIVPTIPRGRYPLAFVRIPAGSTKITNDMVFDARPIFAYTARYHADLQGSDESGCHPIAAISNLESTLADLVTDDNLNSRLLDKADVDGTISPMFLVNKDFVGVPSEDVYFAVERGASSNVAIRWKEDLNRWQYTYDGTEWFPLGGLRTISTIDEPTLNFDGDSAIWIDTDDSNRVYLVYRRGTGDQVKIELT